MKLFFRFTKYLYPNPVKIFLSVNNREDNAEKKLNKIWIFEGGDEEARLDLYYCQDSNIIKTRLYKNREL